MKKELEDKLYEKYPKIFRQKDLPMSETCMCWGVDCGDGWYNLIDTLCSLLQWDIDKNGEPQLEAAQVKEKFGGLRFYADTESKRQGGMIRFAEAMSEQTCEACGLPGRPNEEGWISTLCDKCRTTK